MLDFCQCLTSKFYCWTQNSLEAQARCPKVHCFNICETNKLRPFNYIAKGFPIKNIVGLLFKSKAFSLHSATVMV